MNSLTKSVSVLIMMALSTLAFAELPQVSDARIVQPPPGSKVAAAYFNILNPGTEPLVITDASSDINAKVEVHLSAVVDDVATMKKQDSVVIEPGRSLAFKQGSYHIMFMGVSEPLTAGNEVNVTLVTNVGPISVSVPVISLEEASTHQGSHSMPGSGHKQNHEMTDGAMKKDHSTMEAN